MNSRGRKLIIRRTLFVQIILKFTITKATLRVPNLKFKKFWLKTLAIIANNRKIQKKQKKAKIYKTNNQNLRKE